MSRSKWKGLFCNIKNNKSIQIWSRNSSIPFFLLNKNVYVYNGKMFKKILITREKIGFKFGEFVFTKNKTNKKVINKKYGSKK